MRAATTRADVGRDAARARRGEPPPAAAARWADLPQEVLGLILARLSLRDRCRAVTVCRAWRALGNAQPDLWRAAAFAGDAADPAALISPLRWCAARGSALAELTLRWDAYEPPPRRYDYCPPPAWTDPDAVWAEGDFLIAAALALSRCRLRALRVLDPNAVADGVWTLFTGARLDLLGDGLRGLRELTFYVHGEDTWPALARLKALTRLEARADPRSRNSILGRDAALAFPPNLRELSLDVRGARWELPDAITALRDLTELAFGGDPRETRGMPTPRCDWAPASWARVAALTALERLALAGYEHHFLPGLDLGLAALSRLSHLDLSTCYYEGDVGFSLLAMAVRRASAPWSPQNSRAAVDADPRPAPPRPVPPRPAPPRPAPRTQDVAALPLLHTLRAPYWPCLDAALAATTTLRRLALVAEPPRDRGRYLEQLTRLECVAAPSCDVGLLADAVALRELVLVSAAGDVGTDDESADNESADDESADDEGASCGLAAPLGAAGEGADGEGDPFADAIFERIAQQPLPALERVMLTARNVPRGARIFNAARPEWEVRR